MQHNSFYAPPAVAGTAFEDLLATFQLHVPRFKALPPNDRFRWKSDIVIAPGLGALRRNRYSADWSVATQTSVEGLNIVLPLAGGTEATIGTRTVMAPPLTALLAPSPLSRRGTA